MTHAETIVWKACADGLPDVDTNVLCFDAESELAMEGWLDCEASDDDGLPLWRDVTAIELRCVTHWAEMPAGPPQPEDAPA